jgi:hypothetical protein
LNPFGVARALVCGLVTSRSPVSALLAWFSVAVGAPKVDVVDENGDPDDLDPILANPPTEDPFQLVGTSIGDRKPDGAIFRGRRRIRNKLSLDESNGPRWMLAAAHPHSLGKQRQYPSVGQCSQMSPDGTRLALTGHVARCRVGAERRGGFPWLLTLMRRWR